MRSIYFDSAGAESVPAGLLTRLNTQDRRRCVLFREDGRGWTAEAFITRSVSASAGIPRCGYNYRNDPQDWITASCVSDCAARFRLSPVQMQPRVGKDRRRCVLFREDGRGWTAEAFITRSVSASADIPRCDYNYRNDLQDWITASCVRDCAARLRLSPVQMQPRVGKDRRRCVLFREDGRGWTAEAFIARNVSTSAGILRCGYNYRNDLQDWITASCVSDCAARFRLSPVQMQPHVGKDRRQAWPALANAGMTGLLLTEAAL